MLGTGVAAFEDVEKGQYVKATLKTGLAATEAIGIGALKKLVTTGAQVGLKQGAKCFTKQGVKVLEKEAARGVGKTAPHLVNIEKRLERASAGVKAAYKSAKEWLGEGASVIKNKAGDYILMSKDGLRKMRFDIKNPHGDIPHLHLQILKNGEWTDAIEAVHRIYPKK